MLSSLQRSAVLAAIILGACSAYAGEASPTMDDYMAQAMLKWQVPGLAVAIVRDDEVTVARGYGVCKAGGERQVTQNTRFPIASCSKSFTATAIGLLVDDKKLAWDDPVVKHMPEFRLYDPFVTREVTIRDLLAHRTGLELSDLLWSKNEFTVDEIMQRLRHVKPKHSFRSKFTYNNLTYLVAGQIVERVSGMSWGEFVETRILQPLQMRKSTTSFPAAGDVAWPHMQVDEKVITIELERHYADTIAPAGSIWSTAADMALWIQWNLNAKQAGKRLAISPDSLLEMHSPQIVIAAGNQGAVYPAKQYAAHGLGWFVEDYRGRKLVRHSGSRNGYVSWVAMLPAERFGFVILANSHRTGINFALHHRLLDEFLGEPSKDWSTIVWNNYTNGWQKTLREARSNYEQNRQRDTKPDLEPPRFAGTYRNELYGDLTVRESSGRLELRFGPRRIATFEHWQNNTFEADFANPMVEDWHVTFKVGDTSKVESLQAVAAPWAPAWYDDGTVVGNFKRVETRGGAR